MAQKAMKGPGQSCREAEIKKGTEVTKEPVRSSRNDHVNFKLDQLGREHGQPIAFSLSVAILNDDVLSLNIDAERPSVSVPLVSYIYAAVADAYKKVGQVEDGLKILAMELDAAKSSGSHLWEAELYRGKGELLLAQEGKDQEAKDKDENVSEAEACFHKGLEVSRSQNAKSLELRAAMSLGRLWQK